MYSSFSNGLSNLTIYLSIAKKTIIFKTTSQKKNHTVRNLITFSIVQTYKNDTDKFPPPRHKKHKLNPLIKTMVIGSSHCKSLSTFVSKLECRITFFHRFLGKPQKRSFFSGPATKALPPPLPRAQWLQKISLIYFSSSLKKRAFYSQWPSPYPPLPSQWPGY